MFGKKTKETEKKYKTELNEQNQHIHRVLRSMAEFNEAYYQLKERVRDTYWNCDGLTYGLGRPFDDPIEVKLNDDYVMVAGFDEQNDFVYWFEETELNDDEIDETETINFEEFDETIFREDVRECVRTELDSFRAVCSLATDSELKEKHNERCKQMADLINLATEKKALKNNIIREGIGDHWLHIKIMREEIEKRK